MVTMMDLEDIFTSTDQVETFSIQKRSLEKWGSKKGTFLDSGCGEGHFSIAASEMVGDHGKVYAIDISEDAINILKGEIDERGIETFTGDMTEELPMENESIDACLMANMLHGLVVSREVEGTLKEIFRVLKRMVFLPWSILRRLRVLRARRYTSGWHLKRLRKSSINMDLKEKDR